MRRFYDLPIIYRISLFAYYTTELETIPEAFARTVYHLLKYRVPYEDIGAEEFARKQQERDVQALRKRAAKLGLTLVATEVTQGAA